MFVSSASPARPRLLVAALTAAAILAFALAGEAAALAPDGGETASSSRSRPGTCASSSANPHAMAYTAARSATLCLINAERRRRGLRPLRHNRRLARAASRHGRDMVRRRYFSHDSIDGRDFVERILRTRYVRTRRGDWLLGENLGWGSGTSASPRAMVRAWMRSRGHRRNILRRGYREIGVALVLRAPVSGAGRGVTYVTEFGAR